MIVTVMNYARTLHGVGPSRSHHAERNVAICHQRHCNRAGHTSAETSSTTDKYEGNQATGADNHTTNTGYPTQPFSALLHSPFLHGNSNSLSPRGVTQLMHPRDHLRSFSILTDGRLSISATGGEKKPQPICKLEQGSDLPFDEKYHQFLRRQAEILAALADHSFDLESSDDDSDVADDDYSDE